MRNYFLILLLAATAMSALSRPSAAETFPPITSQAVNKECGDCHMVYFAEMLPRRSWINIMKDLSNHFGEDASIDTKAKSEILTYLVNNASDVANNRAARKWRQGLGANPVTERIITAPRFIEKHDDSEFTAMWKKLGVKSKSDCVACHKEAQQGIFED
ncbi:MAG: cytochrome C [Rhodospirillaceae bacterium]|nr:cytochrome C [Rhodospirillaceae bacterium]